MRRVQILSVVLLSFFVTGCAATVQYKFDRNMYVREKAANYNLVVDIFEDVRPSEEKAGALNKGPDLLYSKDKDFKPNLNSQISQMIVTHLKKANLFRNVSLLDIDNNLEQNNQEMERLNQQGIDLTVTGNLQHFYGYQSGATSSGVSVLFGLAGVLTEALINQKTVGALVEYDNVKVIDLSKKAILWQGNVRREFEEKDTFYDGPVAYVLRALKETNNQLSKDIGKILP